MNENEIVKIIDFTKEKGNYRLIKYVDGTHSFEYLAKSIIIDIDESILYQTPFSNKYFYEATVVSDFPNGERKKHTAAILKENYENSMVSDLYQPGSQVIVAIKAEGEYACASSVELPNFRQPLENRNELNFSFLNKDLFLVKSNQVTNNNPVENIVNALEEEILEDLDYTGLSNMYQNGDIPIGFFSGLINEMCHDLKIKLEEGHLSSELTEYEIQDILIKVNNRINSNFNIQ